MIGKFEIRGGQFFEGTLPTSCVVSRASLFFDSGNDNAGGFDDSQDLIPSHELTEGIWYKIDTAGIVRPLGDEPDGDTLCGPLIVKTTKDQSCQESGKAPIALGDFYGKSKVVAAKNFAIGDELTADKVGYLSNSVNSGDLVVARCTSAYNNASGTAGNATTGVGYTTRQCGYVKA